MRPQVAILGGGISGLALAYYLKRRGIAFSLYEKAERLGGKIHSFQKGGFLFEKGPRSLRVNGHGKETLDLAHSLGLAEQLIYENPLSKGRYLYLNQTLKKISFKSSFAFSLAKALFCDLTRLKGKKEDESIADFSRRKFGRFASETFIEPLTIGIFGGDYEKLSVQSCFPKWVEWQKETGSVFLGAMKEKWHTKSNAKTNKQLFSFKGGLQNLIHALTLEVKEQIHLGKEIISLGRESGGIKVTFSEGNSKSYRTVVSCLPSLALASLVEREDSMLKDVLKEISFLSLGVVNVGFKRLRLQRNGFGYLIPSKEKQPVLGCVFDSLVFPDQNQGEEEGRLTFMLKGPSSLEERAKEALVKHLGVMQEPDCIDCYYDKEAIAQYAVGHLETIRKIEDTVKKDWTHLHLLGSSFYGVSVNECIAFAKKAASTLTWD